MRVGARVPKTERHTLTVLTVHRRNTKSATASLHVFLEVLWGLQRSATGACAMYPWVQNQ